MTDIFDELKETLGQEEDDNEELLPGTGRKAAPVREKREEEQDINARLEARFGQQGSGGEQFDFRQAGAGASLRTDQGGPSDIEVILSRMGDNIITRAATRPLGDLTELGLRAGSDFFGIDREDKPFPSQSADGFLEPITANDEIREDQKGFALLGDILGEGIASGTLFAGAARGITARILAQGDDAALRSFQAQSGDELANQLALRSNAGRRQTAANLIGAVNKQGNALPATALTSGGNLDTVVSNADTIVGKIAGIPKRAYSAIPDFALNVLGTATRNPATFAKGELAFAGTSALPGAIGAEGGGETGALAGTLFGALTPAGIAARSAGPIKTSREKLKGLYKGLGDKDPLKRPKINAKARQAISNLAKEFDTDPKTMVEEIAAGIRRADELETAGAIGAGRSARDLPVGSLTGNDALVGLQRAASRESVEVGSSAKEGTATFLDSLAELDTILRSTGNPRDLAIAAKVREEYLASVIDNNIRKTGERALRRLDEIAPAPVREGIETTSDARRKASEEVFNTLNEARQRMREVERSLHVQGAGDATVGPEQLSGFRQELEQVEAGDFASIVDSLPRIKVIREAATQEEAIPLERLINLRSSLLDEIVSQRSKGNQRAAQIIRGFERELKSVVDSQNIPGLKIAREFSFQFNERFTRTFINRALETTRGGAQRIEPEELLFNIVNVRGDSSVIRLDQLREGARFTDTSSELQELAESAARGDTLGDIDSARQKIAEAFAGFDGPFGTSIMDETDTFIRALASEFRVVDNGVEKIDANALARFVRQNENTVLNRFRDLKDELTNARSAAQAVRNAEARAKRLNSPSVKRRLFGGLLGADNPTPIVQEVLRSNSRSETIERLASLAKAAESGKRTTIPATDDVAETVLEMDTVPGAVEGLRNTILDAAYQNSRSGQNFQWTDYRDALFSPQTRDGKSLIGQMEDLGLIDAESVERLTDMINAGVRTQTALQNPSDIEEILGAVTTTSPIKDMVAAIGGSAAASGLMGIGRRLLGIESGVGNIVAQGAGAKASRQIFLRGNQAKVRDLVIEATSNSELFLRLMRDFDPQNVNEISEVYRQLEGVIQATGFQITEDYIQANIEAAQDIIEEEPEAVEPQALPEGESVQTSATQEEPIAEGFFDGFGGAAPEPGLVTGSGGEPSPFPQAPSGAEQPAPESELPVAPEERPEFLAKVDDISAELNFNPDDLVKVINFETGGSFASDQRNNAGSGATGLIQFMEDTAIGLGTSTEELAQMRPTEQLDFVREHLRTHLRNTPNPTLSDVYMAVLFPRAVGEPDDTPVFQQGDRFYQQNSGLDLDGDGIITKGEATAKVEERASIGLPTNAFFDQLR